MATRQSFGAEALSETTTTSATFADKVALQFTPDASTSYFVFANSFLRHSATTSRAQHRFHHDTAASVLALIEKEPVSTISYAHLFSFTRYTAPASPDQQTFSLEFAATAGTARARDATVVAIQQGANDQYAESNAQSTTTSTTLQDKTTLQFTPPSSGDYLILACADFNLNTTANGNAARVLLDHGGTVHGEATRNSRDAANWYTWSVAIRKNLAASSQTFKIQYAWAVSTGTIAIRNARIIALRLADMPANYYAENLASASTSAQTFQNRTTLTQTPQNVLHLLFQSAFINSDLSTAEAEVRAAQDSTVLGTTSEHGQASAAKARQEFPHFVMRRATLSAASTSWTNDWRYTGTVGSETLEIWDSTIALIQLEDSGTVVDSDHALAVDFLATIQKNAVVPADYLVSILRNATVPYDWLSVARADRVLTVEALARINDDNALNADWSGRFNRDNVLRVEFKNDVRMDRALQADWLSTLNSSRAANADWLQTVNDDNALNADWGGPMSRDGVLRADWKGSVAGERSTNVSWLSRLNADRTAPADWLANIFRSHVPPVDYLANVADNTAIPMEWRGAVAIDRDVALPVEWKAVVLADLAIPVEHKAIIELSRTVPADWLTGVALNRAVVADWLQGAAVNRTAAYDWLAQVNRDDALPAEWRGTLARDTAIPADWKQDVADNLHTMAAEWLSRLSKEATAPVDWALSIAVVRDAVLNVEWDGIAVFQPGNTFIFAVSDTGTVYVADLRDVLVSVEARDTVWEAPSTPEYGVVWS